MTNKPMHVLVVGAGLAGLSLAQGLKKNNISFTIVDRETAPRGRNWGVTLTWGHACLEKLLPAELYGTLQACQPDDSVDAQDAPKQYALIRDGVSGKTLKQIEYPGIRRLQIQKTKRHLARGLNIQYGKKLADIEITAEGPVARFEDGSSEAATVIVGADGGVSQVRRWLLGEKAAQEVLPYTFMNFPFSLPAEEAVWLEDVMNPNVDVAPHPKSMYLGIFLLDKPVVDKPETWVFYILTTWVPTKEDEDESQPRIKRLKEMIQGWADPYKKVVDLLPDDADIRPDQLRIWHPVPWDNHNGMVTLAGDAAHSMTFHRGQGGNIAVRDAYEFVNKMIAVREGKQSLSEAISEYDEGVVLAGQEVAVSKEQTMAFHDYENFLNSPIFKMSMVPVGAQ